MKDVKNTTLWVQGRDLIAHISLEGDIEVLGGHPTELRRIAVDAINISVPIQLSLLAGSDRLSATQLTMSLDLDIIELLNIQKQTLKKCINTIKPS